ncbi:uncharacterized protein LOC106641972 isoform X1 [Copidosoma floridanum]|uniref:uncharacterized protein LOC106641972 isoform X1 n=1 Tax=Copidosoma floridanum TaxID=29053 RepID=UPI0006C9A35A|nr:uncharacterized protein LOC106641972 isoform X1 [Copidosoma floridanum]
MSSLQGLPPLPRSLSGFNLNGAGLVDGSAPPPPARSTSKASQQRSSKTPSSTSSLSSQGSTRPSPQGRQLTTLDTQLAILRREMVSAPSYLFVDIIGPMTLLTQWPLLIFFNVHVHTSA